MFNITNMRGKVAKFCIFKTVYRLGEDIVGTFNFSEGDIPCLQVPFMFLHIALLNFSARFSNKKNVGLIYSIPSAFRARKRSNRSTNGAQCRRSV